MVEIRRADPEDWALVRELRLAALQDTPDFFWATHEEEVTQPQSWWRDFIAGGAWFLAFAGARPVGLAAVVEPFETIESQDAAPAGEPPMSFLDLISMWVDPAARGRGLGQSLVEAAMQWARSEGVRELRLWVTEGNDGARRLYERAGFVATGRSTPLPRKPLLLEHEMRLTL